VRIFHDRLQLLLGRQIACELARLHGGIERHGRAKSIDLEHTIDELRRKPRALLHCLYQREPFPDDTGDKCGSSCAIAVIATSPLG